MDRKKLIKYAIDARDNAYAPYSNFYVGAALETSEGVYTGCNVENASYPVGCCAERTAIVKAISDGVKNFKSITIVGGPINGSLGKTAPCGMCRQTIREFCGNDFPIILATSEDEYTEYTLGELLPESFGPENL